MSQVKQYDQALQDYVLDFSFNETENQRVLRENTLKLEYAEMMTPPEQTHFLAWLVRTMDAARVIEIGVFTGYTTLALAQAVPEGGTVVACDFGKTWPQMGIPYWERAGLADRINFQNRPAMETLNALLEAGEAGTYDFVYVDADKIHYADYYEQALKLVRPGGIIAMDNTLWVGEVSVPSVANPATRSVDAFNRQLKVDARVSATLLPLFSGLWLIRVLDIGDRKK